MSLARWNFIKLYVHDLDRMIQFYTDAFGFVVEARFGNEEFEEVLLRQEGHESLFGLLRWNDGRLGEARAVAGVIGMVTEDIEKAMRSAVENGAQIKQAPFSVPGSVVGFVEDPEGNEVEFVQFN